MKIPKNGMEMDGKVIIWGNCWYGHKKRYGKIHYFKSYNCRFDNTCGGTEEILEYEFYEIAEKYAKIFGYKY